MSDTWKVTTQGYSAPVAYFPVPTDTVAFKVKATGFVEIAITNKNRNPHYVLTIDYYYSATNEWRMYMTKDGFKMFSQRTGKLLSENEHRGFRYIWNDGKFELYKENEDKPAFRWTLGERNAFDEIGVWSDAPNVSWIIEKNSK